MDRVHEAAYAGRYAFKLGIAILACTTAIFTIILVFGGLSVKAAVKSYYQFSADFSSAQGQNQWYYKQSDGTKYSDMAWDSANSRWKGAQTFNLITGAWMHPDANDAVIAWVAPWAGTIRLNANTISNPVGGGDGVKVKVMKDLAQVWPLSGWQSIASNSSVNFPDTEITVNQLDIIYFIVNKNGNNSFDTTFWNPSVSYTQFNSYSFSQGFSATQGDNQWHYQQWNGSGYSNMTWDSGNNRWVGAQAFNLIANAWLHPDTNDAVLAWKAPHAGTIRIVGNDITVPGNPAGDGVKVKILKNNTNIWPTSGWQSISANSYVLYDDSIVTVAQNDMIYFIVNKNGNNSYDQTNWNPFIEYINVADVFRLSSDITGLQGEKMWYFEQSDGVNYYSMTWDSANSRWRGDQASNVIGSGIMHPDTNDAVLKWVAPRDGTVKISGATIGAASGGDGVKVKVMYNNANVWPASGWQSIASGSSAAFPETVLTLRKGARLDFIVNRNTTATNDTTTWDPEISYIGKLNYKQSIDLSSTQGTNDWYFQQWNGSSYNNLTWDATDARWEGGGSLLIDNGVMHPDANDVVLAWKAFRDGTIKIKSATISNFAAGGDGVKVKILKNSVHVWPLSGWQSIASQGSAVSPYVNLTVAKNDMIYFIVNKNNTASFDTTMWDPEITYSVYDIPAGLPADSYRFSDGFSAVQGGDQWSYKQWNGSSYSNMTWDAANSRWYGGQANVQIGQGWVNTDANDPVIAWQAPSSGTVSIQGMIDHNSLSGDGVRAKIMKVVSGTATQIWPSSGWQDMIANLTVQPVLQVAVSAGDSIYFQLNKNSGNTNDLTFWDPIVSYSITPQFTTDKVEMVMTKTDASNMDIDVFDSSLSLFPNGTNFDFYYTNTTTRKFTGTLQQPGQTLVYSANVFTNPNQVEGNWWTNNMYKDPSDGGLLAFNHMEGNAVDGFWAIGLSYSDDDGSSFKKLGKIITHNYPEITTDPSKANTNIFGVPFVIKDGYFYIYYGERMRNPNYGFAAVARAPVADVLAAAKTGAVTAWQKYYNGAWNEDGIGGKASPIFPSSNQYDYATHSDAAYSTAANKYFIVGYNHNRGTGMWISFSTDGIAYSSPAFILNAYDDKTIGNLSPYGTVVNTDGSDNGVVGSSFYIYWNERIGKDSYSNQLFRQKLTIN